MASPTATTTSHGEMALAYALLLLERDKTVKLTNYGSFLEQFPPEYECEIVDEHVVELRARRGALAVKLRLQRRQAQLQPALARAAAQALDELRDAVVPLTEQEGAKLFKDVWAARDGYIQVVLDRSTESTAQFFRNRRAMSSAKRSACARWS
jgi:hypothetical protein